MSDETETTQPEETQAPKVPEVDPVDALIDSLADTEYSLDLEEVIIKIKNKAGVLVVYTIRELTGDGRNEYMNFQAMKARYGSDGKVSGIKDIKGLETRLAALSLFGPDNKPVTEKELAAFPGKLLKKIAMIASRISGLDDKAEQRAKNV